MVCMCFEIWNPSIIVNSDQHISFIVNLDGQDIGFSAVYAATGYLQRRSLLQELNFIQHNLQIP